MLRRPWPIVIIAALHILAPIGNAIFSALVYRETPLSYLKAVWANGAVAVALVWLLLPLAGVAIYAMKKWSYPVFLAIMIAVTAGNIASLRNIPGSLTLFTVVFFGIINIGLVGYFLLPAVRRVYFDPTIRWWESRPRYMVELRGSISDATQSESATINDLSEGGALISTRLKLAHGDTVRISIDILGAAHVLDGRVIHERSGGYGVMFVNDIGTHLRWRKVCLGLRLLGLPIRGGRYNVYSDFKRWLSGICHYGKGFVPEEPQRRQEKG